MGRRRAGINGCTVGDRECGLRRCRRAVALRPLHAAEGEGCDTRGLIDVSRKSGGGQQSVKSRLALPWPSCKPSTIGLSNASIEHKKMKALGGKSIHAYFRLTHR